MGLEKWSGLKTEKDFVLSEESALAELKRLCAYYDVDINETAPEQSIAVDHILSRLLNAFRAGKLELKEGDNGLSIIQSLKGGNDIVYREICAADRTKLGAAGDDAVKKMHYLCGILSGLGTDAIGKMTAGDARVAEALAGFIPVLL